jgi:Uma2 family endonuclease
MVVKRPFGPQDQGRPVSYERFLAGPFTPGYRYELIGGKLEVMTVPNQRHDWAEGWLFRHLLAYVALRPGVMNHVTNKARVFVPDAAATTCPEPDIAGYRDFPLERQPEVEWEEVSPILVAEVLSPSDPDKALVRNRDLYWQVPTVREYWVLDLLADPARPRLRVHRRWGGRWRTRVVEFGQTYSTRLLPYLSLVIDPYQRP